MKALYGLSVKHRYRQHLPPGRFGKILFHLFSEKHIYIYIYAELYHQQLLLLIWNGKDLLLVVGVGAACLTA